MMNQSRTLNWISDNNDRRVAAIRTIFYRGLQDHSKDDINYYDFLLVAKKLNFRFEQSSHLMELRKFFFNHKNQLPNKKLVHLLCIEQQSLEQFSDNSPPEKMQAFSYQEQQNLGLAKSKLLNKQQMKMNKEQEEDQSPIPYEKFSAHIKSQKPEEQGQQYHQKLSIILSIKVSQMLKKIKILMEGSYSNPYDQQQDFKDNLISVFRNLSNNQIYFQIFKKGIVSLLKKLQHFFFKERLTISQDDIKAIFVILDNKKIGFLTISDLQILNNQHLIASKITQFYEMRINKRMVKNTLFKLGKNANNIQIYQVKNASLLQFKNIQEGLLSSQRPKQKSIKPKIPHFGPIKGHHLKQSSSSKTKFEAELNRRSNNSSLSTYKFSQADKSLDKERQKIQKIIRGNKQQKRKNDKDTIANKLRKLFIHKVILPRQRLLQQQKMKYTGNKSQSTQMIVKLI